MTESSVREQIKALLCKLSPHPGMSKAEREACVSRHTATLLRVSSEQFWIVHPEGRNPALDQLQRLTKLAKPLADYLSRTELHPLSELALAHAGVLWAEGYDQEDLANDAREFAGGVQRALSSVKKETGRGRPGRAHAMNVALYAMCAYRDLTGEDPTTRDFDKADGHAFNDLVRGLFNVLAVTGDSRTAIAKARDLQAAKRRKAAEPRKNGSELEH